MKRVFHPPHYPIRYVFFKVSGSEYLYLIS